MTLDTVIAFQARTIAFGEPGVHRLDSEALGVGTPST
jgi:hypothetical protein